MKTHYMKYRLNETDNAAMSPANSMGYNCEAFWPCNDYLDGAGVDDMQGLYGIDWGTATRDGNKIIVTAGNTETDTGVSLIDIIGLRSDDSTETIQLAAMQLAADPGAAEYAYFYFGRNGGSSLGAEFILSNQVLGSNKEMLIIADSANVFLGLEDNTLDLTDTYFLMVRKTPSEIPSLGITGNTRSVTDIRVYNSSGVLVCHVYFSGSGGTYIGDSNVEDFIIQGTNPSTGNKGSDLAYSNKFNLQAVGVDAHLYGASIHTFIVSELPSDWETTWYTQALAAMQNWTTAEAGDKILPKEWLFLPGYGDI